MNPGTILPNPTLLKLDRIVFKLEQIKIVVWASPPVGMCPDCGREVFQIHSRYLRTLADIPWQGVVGSLEIHARKFFCTVGEKYSLNDCLELPSPMLAEPGG